MNFSQQDQDQLKKKGLTTDQVEEQLGLFRRGLPFADLVAAATVNKGIEVFSETEKDELIGYFNQVRDKKSLVKFVPASGEASRMFKFLFEFLNDYG